jgi:hypothetical protein
VSAVCSTTIPGASVVLTTGFRICERCAAISPVTGEAANDSRAMRTWHRQQVLIEAKLLFSTMPGTAGISSTLMASRKVRFPCWIRPHRPRPHLMPTNRIPMQASNLAGPVTQTTGSLLNQ